MRWEPNAEFQEIKYEPEKVSILREEKISLEQARNRLMDKTMNVVRCVPEEIPWLASSPKRDEFLTPFKAEVWQSYASALEFLLNGEEIHNIALDKKLMGINKPKIREMLVKNNLVQPELLDEVAHRINIFLHHSLDVEVMKLRVKKLLDKVPGDREIVFEPEEKKKLFEIFDGDHRLQELWANVMARNIRHSSNFECDEKDVKNIETLIGRWMRLNNFENSAVLREKLLALFFNEARKPVYTLHIGRKNDADISLKLAGIKLYKPSNNDRYLEERLVSGPRDFLERRARKTEAVRFLCKLEEVQDSLLDIKLLKPDFYTVGALNDGGGTTNNVYTYSRVINWDVPNDFEIDVAGDWLDMFYDTRFKKADISKDGEKSLGFNNVLQKRWIGAWFAMSHERAHLDFVSIYAINNSWGEASSKLNLWYKAVNIEQSLGRHSVSDKESEEKYGLTMGSALAEGWTILNENLAAKTLLENIDLFAEKNINEVYEQVASRRRARIVNGELIQDHYWLGQRIVAALFMDGYRADNENLAGLASGKEIDQRRKNGLICAREFLGRLDLYKIADLGSRKIFEDTRIEVENVAEIRRKVWVEEGGTKKLVWMNDKKNRLLDYLCSTKPEKRKIGQDKFLELFGKDN